MNKENMSNEFKLLVASLISACVIIFSLILYNVEVHTDKMKAYYICLDKQEKLEQQYSQVKYSAPNLYCSTR